MDIFKKKKIMVLGLGREGVDTLRFFLKNCPESELAAADRSLLVNLAPSAKEILAANPQIPMILGPDYLAHLENYDWIVKSPGIPIHLPEIEQAFKKGRITSQTEIFFRYCPGTIIGVTGTKGKSTTASIICEIIKRAGKKAFLVGNIGTPMLSYLEAGDSDSIYICELSAHQLYGMRQSPRIAVLLNIYPEHLDFYSDYNEYIRSKANITAFQTKDDYLIYNSANQEANGIARDSAAQKIAYNDYRWIFPAKTNLIGDFNLENAKIGAIIGRLLEIPDDVINGAVANFKPLDNRLEFVGNFQGIDCYNDSLSTIQESAVAAIQGLGGRVRTLIAGGFDRGQPFEKLAAAVLASGIRTIILFPTTGARIWAAISETARNTGQNRRLDEISCYFVENMNQACDLVFRETQDGGICLLSAASASFGNFRDYADRGESFKKSLAETAVRFAKP